MFHSFRVLLKKLLVLRNVCCTEKRRTKTQSLPFYYVREDSHGGGSLPGLGSQGRFSEEEATVAKMILLGVNQAKSQQSQGKHMYRGLGIGGACQDGKEEGKERREGRWEIWKEMKPKINPIPRFKGLNIKLRKRSTA